MLLSGGALREAAGGRGRAVELLHCVGDLLWALAPGRPLPNGGFTGEEVQPWSDGDRGDAPSTSGIPFPAGCLPQLRCPCGLTSSTMAPPLRCLGVVCAVHANGLFRGRTILLQSAATGNRSTPADAAADQLLGGTGLGHRAGRRRKWGQVQRTQQHTTETACDGCGAGVAADSGQKGLRQPSAHTEHQVPRQLALMWPTSRDGDAPDCSSPSRLSGRIGACCRGLWNSVCAVS